MKVIFIKPNMGRMIDGPYIDTGRMEPLQIGVLAGLTPDDVEIAFYDDRMEEIPFDEPADLVAITVETFTARRSYEICRKFQARGIPVVMGGMHPTLAPDEVAKVADSIFLGDAETTWPQVIEDARNDRLKPIYRSEIGSPQPNSFTRRDIFEGKGYLPISLLQFSRGCRFSCDFCAISQYFHARHFQRDVSRVIEEIESQNRKYLFFVDDNILSNHEAAKSLFRALIPLKIHWISQGSVDMTQDRELMDLMAKSGCLGNVVGFESLNAESLREAKKQPNLAGFPREDNSAYTTTADKNSLENAYREPLKILRDYGLQTWAAFTLGYDGDSPDTVERTCEFAMRNKFAFAAFNILMPYPGTPFYERLKAEGRLLYDGTWWNHPEYQFNHAAFIPKQMSPEALTEACFTARSRFNRISSIVRRAWDFKTHLRSPRRLGLYLAYNPLVRKEVFKKQGMYLGYAGEEE
jgi:radical SAM superfamily enzyme YgiQ (UPF0313 family)